MTTLATYVFPSAALLSGVTIRAYACGRYLNNTGAQVLPTFTTSVNGVTQARQAVAANSSTIPLAWEVWSHFYFTTAIPNSGNPVAVGSNLSIRLSNQQQNATNTGNFVQAEYLTCLSNPYTTYINPALKTTLLLAFTIAGADVIEQHCGYMEAL